MDMGNFWKMVMEYRNTHKGLREGQILFNVFHKINPDMANFICGREFDPFYDDDRIPAFCNFISNLP